MAMPALPASHSTAPTKSRCSISRTNVMASPPWPQPKHLKKPFSSLTENEAVFSAWNGHRPTQRRPTRFSWTYCETTSRRLVASRTRWMSSSTIPTSEDGSGHRLVRIEEPVEVGAEVGAVRNGTVDEARPAPAQERQADDVHPRRVDDDAAVVAYAAPPVEDGNVEPGVVGPVPRREEHRPDLAAEAERERWLRLHPRGLGTLRRLDVVVGTCGGGPFVEARQQSVHLEVGERAHVGERTGQLRDGAGDAAEATDDAHARIHEPVQIEGRARRRADQLG